MSAHKESERKNKDKIKQALSEMTPARRAQLEEAFCQMRTTSEPIQPEMRAMNFGGDYCFDPRRTQVELNGDFSKDDLLRIAFAME